MVDGSEQIFFSLGPEMFTAVLRTKYIVSHYDKLLRNLDEEGTDATRHVWAEPPPPAATIHFSSTGTRSKEEALAARVVETLAFGSAGENAQKTTRGNTAPGERKQEYRGQGRGSIILPS